MKILLVFLSFFVCFVSLEGAFRFYGRYKDHCSSELKGKNFDKDSFMQLTVPTINPHGGFGLCKGFKGKFQGQEFSTNLYGARGPEFLPVKEEQLTRIVGIGDSVMMGWGVSDSETFMAHLNSNEKIEAINLGVAGLNAVQEFFHLRERALPLHPDLVLISYVGNDWEGENVSREENSFSSPSFFINWLVHRLKGESSADFRATESYQMKPSDGLMAYKAMGWLLKEKKIPCLVVLDSRYESEFVPHKQMEAIVARDMGCEVLNLMKEMRGLEGLSVQEAISKQDRHNAELIIAGDGHPNALWHKEVSSLILGKIKGLIERP